MQQRTRYVIDDDTPFGGFWRRLVAHFIDWVVLFLIGFLGFFLLGFILGVLGEQETINSFNRIFSDDPEVLDENYEAINLIVDFCFVLITWVYYASLTSSSWQATLGKKVLGLKVVDENGDRISFGRATGRYFAKIPSALILYIGFLMVAWTKRKRGLHDMIAGTLVVTDYTKPQIMTLEESERYNHKGS